MAIEAIVFGSLGTISETSELHRQAFNRTFSDRGLEWEWSEETYRSLLQIVGGAERIRSFAAKHGDASVNAEVATDLHRYKTEIYSDLVKQSASAVRSGVVRLISEARQAGLAVGLATSTSMQNVDARLEGSAGALSAANFDAITTLGQLDRGKPAPDAHVVCMSRLSVRPRATVAIEDTESGVASAAVAGSMIVATPGRYALDQDYSSAAAVVTSLGDPGDAGLLVGEGPELVDGVVTLEWLERLRLSAG